MTSMSRFLFFFSVVRTTNYADSDPVFFYLWLTSRHAHFATEYVWE